MIFKILVILKEFILKNEFKYFYKLYSFYIFL